MWFLARFYTAQEAEKMGLINTVVPVSHFHLINRDLFLNRRGGNFEQNGEI